MNDQEFKQYLYDQYVLSLRNDGECYKKVYPIVKASSGETTHYKQFANDLHHFIGSIRSRLLGDSGDSKAYTRTGIAAYSYITAALWEELGGNREAAPYKVAVKEYEKHFSTVDPPVVPKTPDNHGATWTPDQDVRLITMCNQGYSIDQTAIHMGRTERAITLRLEHLQQQSTARANRTGLKPIVTTYNPTTNQENTMSQVNANIAIQNNTYIFGQDVDAMSTAQFIEAIKKLEAQIAALDTIKAKSAKVKALKADLKAQLEQVVAVFDAK